MVKNTIVALVAVASLAGIAVPAFAAPAPVAESESDVDTVFGGGTPEMRAFMADSVLARLQQQGINATSVEDWSGLIRAYVTLDDGTQTMQFYKPGSLEQVLL